ncbi:MAG: acetylxylan esterase [Candidatus Sumerlaeota bacterium]|nr:acetylxylan esterase [Candidatus Sumerlaeota bacterium]
MNPQTFRRAGRLALALLPAVIIVCRGFCQTTGDDREGRLPMPRIPRLFDVLPNETPPDARLAAVRNLNQKFPCPEYASLDEWEREARDIRNHILVACGLWPPPERPPIQPRWVGTLQRDGYTIDKVWFESSPGFIVAGNLYRPAGGAGPFPAVLNPHGHWKAGRLADEERGSVQARAINFALQGYVAFTYDMVGYNDSLQFGHRAFEPQEELWGLSLMGLQLWNSLRCLDFLASLPDVDPKRLGCTGASGGGTQTFMLVAVDDRVSVCAPVNMVSAKMQGGCACENAPLLRIDLINPQIAALAAPRPMLMVSATGDWTSDTPRVEYPFVQSIYRLYGAEERVQNVHVDAKHNYNQQSREAVYRFFHRWLAGGDEASAPSGEAPYQAERAEDLLVFPERKYPVDRADGMDGVDAPDGATLARRMIEDRRQRVADWLEKCARDRQGGALSQLRVGMAHTLNVRQPSDTDFALSERKKFNRDGFRMERFLLGRKPVGDSIPCLFLQPEKRKETAPTVLLVHGEGKSAFFDMRREQPGPIVQALLGKGFSVLAIDPFLTGEYQRTGAQAGRNLGGVAHWSTYNRTDCAERVQDILTAVAWLKARPDVERIDLVGFGEAAVWAWFARTETNDVDRTVLDLSGLDLGADEAWLGGLYIPCVRQCGAAEGAGILLAPAPLALFGVSTKFDTSRIEQAYAAEGKSEGFHSQSSRLSAAQLIEGLR